MERKSCCSGRRCGSTPRVTITPEKKPMNVNIKKEEQEVKPQTLKKEVVEHEATAAAAKGVKVEGKEAASATVKKEEQDVKPQTLKKEVVHEATAAAAKGVTVEGKEAARATVKKEEPVKVNVGCGGGGGCSSFK